MKGGEKDDIHHKRMNSARPYGVMLHVTSKILRSGKKGTDTRVMSALDIEKSLGIDYQVGEKR